MRGGEEASRTTGGGPTGEDVKTIKRGEQRREEGMSGGKGVPVALRKAASARTSEEEDERGASWSVEESPLRWRARAEALAGQQRIV